MLLYLPLALAGPAEIAPAAQELDASESRLEALLATSEGVGAATLRLQVAWTQAPAPKGGPCADHDRLSLGWRVERFGAAWREAVQALRVEGGRLDALRAAPTVAPLVDAARGARIAGARARVDAQVSAFLQASAWEVAYVRPVLSACPLAGPGLSAGVASLPVPARDDPPRPVAVIGRGAGFVCPQGTPADDAVVLVNGGEACWAPDATCTCEPVAVYPGAVLGPPVVEGVPEGG